MDDSSTDDEEGRIARFLSEGYKCQLNDGSPCSALFTASQVMAARDECRQLTRDQLDVMVMGQLRALCQLIQNIKTKYTDCTRTATLFRFGGHRICHMVFLFLHAMSHQRSKAIKKNWRENGLCPRVWSKAVPHNTTKLSDIQNIVRFILHYAEENAILLAGRIPGYKYDYLQLLPSTTKPQVWETHHQSPLEAQDVKAVCYSLFCDLWNQLTRQVALTRPMSDLFWVCIMRAHNQPVEKKSEVHVIIHVCNWQAGASQPSGTTGTIVL